MRQESQRLRIAALGVQDQPVRRRHHRGGKQPAIILDRRQIRGRLDAIRELGQADGNADHQIVRGLVLLQHNLA